MLLEQMASFIEAHGLLHAGEPVVVGFSSGVDSTVLTYALRRLGYRVIAAHVNYGLRNPGAEEDEALVRAYAREWNIPLHVYHPPTREEAHRRRMSLQEVARVLRYEFFFRVAVEEGARRVAVAHHADDQVETILLNLFRGTGPEGLAGMPVRRPLRREVPEGPVLVRPLLFARRRDIEAFAREHHLIWREDPTNAGVRYRRSALRTEIIPRIVEHFGEEALTHILESGDLMRAYVEEGMRPCLEDLFRRAVQELPGGARALRLSVLKGLPAVWQGRLILEVLRRMGVQAPERGVEAVRELLGRQTGRRVVFGNVEVWREREALVFVPAGGKEIPEWGLLAPGRPVRVPDGVLEVDILPVEAMQPEPHTEYADADRLRFPLRVRPWQPGDRFQPLGMQEEKKISDFLTDVRVPSYLRKRVPVVESDGKIVWIPGYRVAEPVRVTDRTRRVARLRFNPSET